VERRGGAEATLCIGEATAAGDLEPPNSSSSSVGTSVSSSDSTSPRNCIPGESTICSCPEKTITCLTLPVTLVCVKLLQNKPKMQLAMRLQKHLALTPIPATMQQC
jgi:hypothetical protein